MEIIKKNKMEIIKKNKMEIIRISKLSVLYLHMNYGKFQACNLFTNKFQRHIIFKSKHCCEKILDI